METITLRLVVEGEDTVSVDRAEYEAAKKAGTVDQLLDAYISDVETETTVVEPDSTCVLLADHGLVLPPPAPVYLVWSNRWSAWRATTEGNYVGDVWSAARFSEAEADEARADEPAEVMVPAPEWGRGHFSASEIAEVPAQMRRMAATKTRIVEQAAVVTT